MESKVCDDFQTNQAEAYLGEVQAQLRKLGPKRAAAVLVAPAGKMASLQHNGAFVADVTIEEIITFLKDRLVHLEEGELSRRLSVRIELLEALDVKRPTSGWVASTVAKKWDFAIAYEQLASEILPYLKVRPSTNGPQAISRIFEGIHTPALPGMKLRHEFGKRLAWKYTCPVPASGKQGRGVAFKRATQGDALPSGSREVEPLD